MTTTDTRPSARILTPRYASGTGPWEKITTAPRELQFYRDSKNQELEDRVDEALRASGYQTMVRIAKARRLGVSFLSGEIDVLATRPGSDAIWLIECKDPTEPHSPAEIRRAWDRFEEPGGYIDKLLRKADDLRREADAVARAVGSALDASIEPIMITRRPTVAGFSQAPRVRFATIEDLPAALDSPGSHD